MYFAHSETRNRPAQYYQDHVEGVMRRAAMNMEAMRPLVELAKLSEEQEGREKTPWQLYHDYVVEAARYHDLGKLLDENQEVLSGGKRLPCLPKEHRSPGIRFLKGEKTLTPPALLVYAHHQPGLPNLLQEKTKCRGASLWLETEEKEEAERAEDVTLCLKRHAEALRVEVPKGSGSGMSKIQKPLDYRILLSALVDADYADTASQSRCVLPRRWEERIKSLDRYVEDLSRKSSNPDDERNVLRSEFYKHCQKAAVDHKLEYCDAPVGTGKTTSVMAHMLLAAKQYNLRHIFVVLPYTSIISQTVEVLRRALVLEGETPASIVAEHHHQADFDGPLSRHLATTWEAPIIVTTAVQFFETLASNQPAKLRKLHQLPGSAVFIDESHAALPQKFLPLAWRWITDLTERWGCRFCLGSGTSFRFWETERFMSESKAQVQPLLSAELSQKMSQMENARVVRNIEKKHVPRYGSIPELAGEIERSEGPRLVVLNTVAMAAALAAYLKQQKRDVLHLSTALTPNDREVIIQQIKDRLKSKEASSQDWTLVATSCVECGMDFSFRNGFCEMRSLSSYLQLGGRISRNGEYRTAELVCFTLKGNHQSYNPAIQGSREALLKQINEGRLAGVSITDAMTENFRIEWSESGVDKDSEALCKYERRSCYPEVSENFRVVGDETTTVLVEPGLIERVSRGDMISSQELVRGSVNVRAKVLEKLTLEVIQELHILSPGQYDPFLGVMKNLT